MRASAGQTFKSSISHSYIIDTRDDRIMATRGKYAKLYNEFAGLGGDASFYKTELEGQVSRPIVDGVVRYHLFADCEVLIVLLVPVTGRAYWTSMGYLISYAIFRSFPTWWSNIRSVF